MSSVLLSPDKFETFKKRAVCGLLASRPLNNLKYTEHLTEMRQRWLTDTSISPAICLTEGGKWSRVPHAWRREHCLLVRGDRKRKRREGEMKGRKRDCIVSISVWWRTQCLFRMSRNLRHVGMVNTSKAYSENVPWLQMVCTSNSTVTPSRVIFSYRLLYPFHDEMQNQCSVSNSLFYGWPAIRAITWI